VDRRKVRWRAVLLEPRQTISTIYMISFFYDLFGS
jgi:hypothetical protein